MRELGQWSEQTHREIGRGLDQLGLALVIGVCGDARWFCAPDGTDLPNRVFASDAHAALDLLLPRTQASDVILVKASRGVGAERVVHGLISTKGRAA
jgi:UDP-N-acetylmuramyl pentapeptide synthase